MKAKHTPGSWVIDYEDDHWQVVHENAVICDIPEHEASEEDARLIAAAPDMLHALEYIKEMFNDQGHMTLENMTFVNCAISKAKGEA